jgi:hypothetical protein
MHRIANLIEVGLRLETPGAYNHLSLVQKPAFKRKVGWRTAGSNVEGTGYNFLTVGDFATRMTVLQLVITQERYVILSSISIILAHGGH